MADSEGKARLTEATLKTITENLPGINAAAIAANVSPAFIAGPIAREMNKREVGDYGGQYYLSWKDGLRQHLARYGVDFGLGDNLRLPLTSQEYQDDAKRVNALDGTNTIDRLLHPTMSDLGPANIRPVAAINALDFYLNHRSFFQGKDPLGLDQYSGHLDRLVTDLYNPDSRKAMQTAIAISAANAAMIKDWMRRNVANWSGMTPDQQAELVAAYSASGGSQFLAKYNAAVRAGTPYSIDTTDENLKKTDGADYFLGPFPGKDGKPPQPGDPTNIELLNRALYGNSVASASRYPSFLTQNTQRIFATMPSKLPPWLKKTTGAGMKAIYGELAQATDIPLEGRALLATIASTEAYGNDPKPFNLIYNGDRKQHVDDLSQHPNTRNVIKRGPNAGKVSTAAGAFQMTNSTWSDYGEKAGLRDFGPHNQAIAAWHVARDRFAASTGGGDLLQALQSGDPVQFAQVGSALKGTWTSLPGGIEQGQDENAMLQMYRNSLDRLSQPTPSFRTSLSFGDLDAAMGGRFWRHPGARASTADLMQWRNALPAGASSSQGAPRHVHHAGSSRMRVSPPAKSSARPPASLQTSVSHQAQVDVHLDGSKLVELLLPKIESTLVKYMTAMADGAANDIAFASSPGTARG